MCQVLEHSSNLKMFTYLLTQQSRGLWHLKDYNTSFRCFSKWHYTFVDLIYWSSCFIETCGWGWLILLLYNKSCTNWKGVGDCEWGGNHLAKSSSRDVDCLLYSCCGYKFKLWSIPLKLGMHVSCLACSFDLGTSYSDFSLSTCSWGCCLGIVKVDITSGIWFNVLFIYLLLKFKVSSSSLKSNTLCWLVLCPFLSSFGLIIGDLLNGLKGCLVIYNLSFNSKALTLDVEACCALASSCMVNICGLFSGKKCCIYTFMTNAKWHTSFLTSTFILPFSILSKMLFT